MKGTMEQGQKFRTEATHHLVNAHGLYEGALRLHNFQVGGAYADMHTVDHAIADALTRYGHPFTLCVGAKGIVCSTCNRLLTEAGVKLGEKTDYTGRSYWGITRQAEFINVCCTRDPENNRRPFPSQS